MEERLRELRRIGGDGQHIVGGRTAYSGGDRQHVVEGQTAYRGWLDIAILMKTMSVSF